MTNLSQQPDCRVQDDGLAASVRSRLATKVSRRYDLGPELGRGATAIVFRAYDRRLNRHVAFKVLRSDVDTRTSRRRFGREITVLAGLQHPNILPLHDCGSVGGLFYHVTPYIEGESLRQRLVLEGRLPLPDAVRIATDLADALDHIHQRGIVHRDVKPENVLLSDGRAILADFGIACLTTAPTATQITEEGFGMPGTLLYMSPEQRYGAEQIDGGTDIYSLGIVLLEMLTGAVPRWIPAGDADRARARRELLRSLRSDVPRAVEASIQRALRANRHERFASASDFSASLSGTGNHIAQSAAEDIRDRLSDIISRVTGGLRKFSNTSLRRATYTLPTRPTLPRAALS